MAGTYATQSSKVSFCAVGVQLFTYGRTQNYKLGFQDGPDTAAQQAASREVALSQADQTQQLNKAASGEVALRQMGQTQQLNKLHRVRLPLGRCGSCIILLCLAMLHHMIQYSAHFTRLQALIQCAVHVTKLQALIQCAVHVARLQI